jgi:hypothetical protein
MKTQRVASRENGFARNDNVARRNGPYPAPLAAYRQTMMLTTYRKPHALHGIMWCPRGRRDSAAFSLSRSSAVDTFEAPLNKEIVEVNDDNDDVDDDFDDDDDDDDDVEDDDGGGAALSTFSVTVSALRSAAVRAITTAMRVCVCVFMHVYW